MEYCTNCGRPVDPNAAFCAGCGSRLQNAQQIPQENNQTLFTGQVQNPNVFCKNCGQPMDSNAAVCMKCGFAKGTGRKYCATCGKEIIEGAAICLNCGTPPGGYEIPGQKSKMIAGLLGIFLGAWGVHQFYLGKIVLAVIHLVLGILGLMLFCVGSRMWFGGGYVTLGMLFIMGSGIWGLIEGIFVLTGHTRTDAKGNMLKD